MPQKEFLRPQPLEECVQNLLSITRNVSTKSVKETGDLYLASLSLLYHLKEDQVKLHRVGSNIQNGTPPHPPPPDEIPAVTAVLQDPKLFRALLVCLKSPTTSDNSATVADPSSETSIGSHFIVPLARFHGSSFPISANRKRSLSFVSDHDMSNSSKAMKLAQSPTVSSIRQAHIKNDGLSERKKPSWNIPAMVACIFYSSLSHVDHWPVALVKAYADDCFGARSWVDADECRPLIENLTLCHTGDCYRDEPANGKCLDITHAQAAWEYYSRIETAPTELVVRDVDLSSDVGSIAASPRLQSRRSSLSNDSIDSHSSKPPPTRVLSRSVDSREASVNADDCEKGDGNSSSSGEEDEEIVAMAESFGEDIPPLDKPQSDGQASVANTRTFPICPRSLDLTRVRQRYFGVNLLHAHDVISSSLSSRLDVKSKQNSGLLQALPSFASIPSIRSLIAQHLEKWLQSPALSGLARALFVATVSHMKNVQPTLPEDVQAIDSILRMKLKANQLNAHIENVTAIAKRIPTVAVARQIFLRLLREVLHSMESADRTSSDQLKLLAAVHIALPGSLSAEGLGEALLMFLANPNDDDPSSARQTQAFPQRDPLVRKLRAILRGMAFALGQAFDGCGLLEALLSFDVRTDSWSVRDEEDKGRLMYQCAILLVGQSQKSDQKLLLRPAHQRVSRCNSISNVEDDGNVLRNKLIHARKLLLNWCCTDYAAYFPAKDNMRTANVKRSKREEVAYEGAGAPDFRSVLDGRTTDFVPCIRVMRSVLFMEFPDSPYLQQFMYPDGSFNSDDTEWQDERYQIARCCELGTCLDDDMLRIVLESASLPNEGISADMALSLIEHLVGFCNKSHAARLLVSDPFLVHQLYNLSVYSPPVTPRTEAMDDSETNCDTPDKSDHYQSIPRLAYPGRWWRVTSVVLVLCGSSPEKIGAVVWDGYPTLKALLKMVTSLRYRFPTVDCDDATREEVKKAEAILRNEESRLAETLFLPPRVQVKDKTKVDLLYKGSRVSKRQQEKQERLLSQQREKEAAKAHEEENRRKKALRSVQKTIMLWDPTGPARKPPRESVDLLLSVEQLFGLSSVFQKTSQPDLLLGTIGSTTRGAIERAYDWIIPIISSLPDIISRLPANASCFLLLRAYGNDGGERAQLRELSTPLLLHIRHCLRGKFGRNDAVRAADLLLTDVASPKPERRRCARRVLQEAIGRLENEDVEVAFKENNCSWMETILKAEHADDLVCDFINHLSVAVSYERGRVLRALVVALEKYYSYASGKGIETPRSYESILFELLSSRPSVCVDAMVEFKDLQSVAIRTVYVAFDSYLDGKSLTIENDDAVKLIPCDQSVQDESTEHTLVCPFQLVQSICVVLSTWEAAGIGEPEREGSSADSIRSLVNSLLHPSDTTENREGNVLQGLAGANWAKSGKRAVTVDSWVLLAKSRSDYIAKQAASAAPVNFIPRLLICSGLPRSSLQTMIDRLGKLGDQSVDRDHVFCQLLSPSATTDWDVGRFGTRRELARKMIGRLSAYGRVTQAGVPSDANGISLSFLEWLSKDCRGLEKPRKKKTKKSVKGSSNIFLSNASAASTILDGLDTGDTEYSTEIVANDSHDLITFRTPMEIANETKEIAFDGFDPAEIENNVETGKLDVLTRWLEKEFPHMQQVDLGCIKSGCGNHTGLIGFRLAESLLRGALQCNSIPDATRRLIMEWIPSLTQFQGSAELWQLLFFSEDEASIVLLETLLTKCIAVWSNSHANACRNWILAHAQSERPTVRLDRAARFLVLNSGQRSVNIQSFYDKIPDPLVDKSWGRSQDFVNSCAHLALDALEQGTNDLTSLDCIGSNPSDGLTLLLLLASQGRSQVFLVTTIILQQAADASTRNDKTTANIFRIALLRVYLQVPYSMDLRNPAIREALVEAAGFCTQVWQKWHYPLDDQTEDMMDSVLTCGTPRIVQAMSEMAKNHPLLIIRKLPLFIRALELDAGVDMVGGNALSAEKRGMILAEHAAGPREAKISGRIVTVTIRHWGYGFSESIWLAVLEIVTNIPKPLLFDSGLKLGILDFFCVYVKVTFIQSQLSKSVEPGTTSRLKIKLSAIFTTWKGFNATSWEEWLAAKIVGLDSFGTTRSVLVSSDLLNFQEAIDNLKRKHREDSS